MTRSHLLAAALGPARRGEDAVNASEVVTAIRRHYGDAWALVEQVGNGTGYSANRHLDIVAFGLWPSRGLEIHGIEVKVSRSDVRREMAQPEKADAVAKMCDRFWLATPAGLVDAEALAVVAPAWGLLEVDGAGRVQTRRQAEKTPAEPVNRHFLAAIMRRLPQPSEAIRREIETMVRAQYETEVEAAVAGRSAASAGRYERIVERVERFIELTGIDLLAEGYDNPFAGRTSDQIAAAVAFLMREQTGGWKALATGIESAASGAEREAKRLVEIAKELRVGAAALTPIRPSP